MMLPSLTTMQAIPSSATSSQSSSRPLQRSGVAAQQPGSPAQSLSSQSTRPSQSSSVPFVQRSGTQLAHAGSSAQSTSEQSVRPSQSSSRPLAHCSTLAMHASTPPSIAPPASRRGPRSTPVRAPQPVAGVASANIANMVVSTHARRARRLVPPPIGRQHSKRAAWGACGGASATLARLRIWRSLQ